MYTLFHPNDISASERQNFDKVKQIFYPNLNSAITNYQPDDFFYDGQPMTLKGYAFSGRGIKISRVEISTDGGKKWVPTNLKQSTPSLGRPTDEDKSWTWTIWEHEFPHGFS